MNYHTVKGKSNEGFTLVELLVTIGIFAVLTGVVLGNYRGYDSNAQFANASEDVVLALRQAQVYGVGVKGCGTANPFDCAFGVYFTTATSTRSGITVFADTDGNRVFTTGEDAGLTSSSVKWASTIYVSSLVCDGFPCSTGIASVTFKRPNPDAFISDIPPASTSTSPYYSVDITLRDANTGKTALVKITRAGQISIQ